ncbi:MAG TPA: 50S ribosomal protein L15 [candidate division Zixibacteria bacterium]|nr:50S ribosomal protein L15 [candidate division Zixibacteria bacterium]
MKLGNLKPPKGSRKSRKRVGRGESSGVGKTSGKGHKGQMSRSGVTKRSWMEGGQMPLARRLPKKGFSPPVRTIYQVVNIRDLNRFEDGQEIDILSLRENGLISRKLPVKLLSDGELRVKVTIKVNSASKSAIEKVEQQGGKVEII